MKNILLLEDNESLSRGISFKLRKEGYNVFTSSTVKDAYDIFYSNTIDLIISDIGLLDGSGLDFCEKIRKESNVIIIFLSALDQEIDIVNGYDIGADDYITKPFSLMVLISKVNAFMRRVNENENNCDSYNSGDITLNVKQFKVLKNNEELELTKIEFKILKYLMLNSRQIVTKEQLLQAVWENEGDFIENNTLAVNIRRLREKIEDTPSKPKYIKNIRGIGYVWSVICNKND